MDFGLSEEDEALARAAGELAGRFDAEYWRGVDSRHEFAWDFYTAFAEAGWFGLVLPEEYGGAGRGIQQAARVMQAIAAAGAGGMNAASTIHLTIFSVTPLIKHGSEAQKRKYLPPVAEGKLHVSFAVTEPNAGTDTSRIETFARRDGDNYVISGRKVWISKAQQAQKLLLLTRTTPRDRVRKRTDGMTLFFADLDRERVAVREIPKVGRNAVNSNELFIDELVVPADDRIGEEGQGFRYILDGMNPERILIAAEAVGVGQAALGYATEYAKGRVVFDRPIGQNQGIAFPLAESHAKLAAAELLVYKAAWLYDNGLPCGAEANMAKYLAAQAAYEACDRAVQTLGGFGYAEEYHVARLWKEARLMRIVPISENLILSYVAEHVLGLPRSY
jgi:acyl-CoA dehydrogenase